MRYDRLFATDPTLRPLFEGDMVVGATNRLTAPAYWKFESISLQQTVRLSRDFSFLYRKAGSCRGVHGPGQAVRPAETPRARQHHANCR